ncbi:hypothetical protein Pmar_PMAR008875, partial [Perkinsus marinus ATCC 50983]
IPRPGLLSKEASLREFTGRLLETQLSSRYLAGATSRDPLDVQKTKFNRLMVSSVSQADTEKAQSLLPQHIRARVQVVPMKTMNSYLNIYTQGDWILHFSGVSDKHSATA